MTLVSFYTPWIPQKAKVFLIIFWGIEGKQWYEMSDEVSLKTEWLVSVRMICFKLLQLQFEKKFNSAIQEKQFSEIAIWEKTFSENSN